jgi:hypothetical protein
MRKGPGEKEFRIRRANKKSNSNESREDRAVKSIKIPAPFIFSVHANQSLNAKKFYLCEDQNTANGMPWNLFRGGKAGTRAYIIVMLYKGKLSRNYNEENKNCGSNHRQKSSPKGWYIRTMFGYATKLGGYAK